MTLDILVRDVALWGIISERAPIPLRHASHGANAETRVETLGYFELPAAPVT